MQTTIHLVEALEIVDDLITRGDAAWLYAQVPIFLAESRELARENVDCGLWQRQRRPCPLLIGDECSVYDVRPSACRVWISFSDPALCAIDGAKVSTFDRGWVTPALMPRYAEAAERAGIYDAAGPLQFVMLLGIMAHMLGQVSYERRVRGTWLSSAGASCLMWMHLERGLRDNWRELRTRYSKHARRAGLQSVTVGQVLAWPEMTKAIKLLGEFATAAKEVVPC